MNRFRPRVCLAKMRAGPSHIGCSVNFGPCGALYSTSPNLGYLVRKLASSSSLPWWWASLVAPLSIADLYSRSASFMALAILIVLWYSPRGGSSVSLEFPIKFMRCVPPPYWLRDRCSDAGCFDVRSYLR